MRLTFAFLTKVFLALGIMIPAAQAQQMRLGGSKPSLLMPRPAPSTEGQRIGGELQQPGQRTIRMTLIDPGPIGAETTTNLYFAQVAVGGGYVTVFGLVNTGSTPAVGNLILKDQSGNDFLVSGNAPSVRSEPSSNDLVNATGSSFPLTIPGGGTRFFAVSAINPSDATKSGWARFQSAGGSMGGVGTFQFTQGGVLSTVAGVLASQPVQFATIPVDDNDSQRRYTGYAVANQGDQNINVKLVLVNEDGTIAESINPPTMNPLPALRQVARFLSADFPARPTFKGSMVLIGQGGNTFVVVALVLNQGLFTAIPVIPEKAPGIN
jgi:hypothetical protein